MTNLIKYTQGCKVERNMAFLLVAKSVMNNSACFLLFLQIHTLTPAILVLHFMLSLCTYSVFFSFYTSFSYSIYLRTSLLPTCPPFESHPSVWCHLPSCICFFLCHFLLLVPLLPLPFLFLTVFKSRSLFIKILFQLLCK